MSDEWKNLWKKRTVSMEELSNMDEKKLFLELKRSNGFDVYNGKMTYESYIKQYEDMKAELEYPDKKIVSVYEVGCGSGANLFLFLKEGYRCGGCDYSDGLISSAKEVLQTFHCEDIVCCEAAELNAQKKYDTVFSNSVFSYFENLDYAKEVLQKMLEKTNYSIGLLDIHDDARKEEFLAYRKSTIENYEEKYKKLSKLFYKKQFFRTFAEENNLTIKF